MERNEDGSVATAQCTCKSCGQQFGVLADEWDDTCPQCHYVGESGVEDS